METTERGVSVAQTPAATMRQWTRGWLSGWTWLLVITHIAAIIPFIRLIWDGLHDNLTVNPIQEITFRTGFYAIVLLILSLVCTPVNVVFGWRQVLPLRRPLGLYAFFYATLHFLTFVWLDYGLDWELIKGAFIEKWYALIGLAAFVLLLPLALTSTRWAMRKLGKYWKQLHRVVYIAALLAVFHWVLLVKSDIREPLLYGAGVALLLILRVPAVKRWFTTLRTRKR